MSNDPSVNQYKSEEERNYIPLALTGGNDENDVKPDALSRQLDERQKLCIRLPLSEKPAVLLRNAQKEM